MTTLLNEQHDSAARRLHAKLVEQHRLDERFHAAIGTTTEAGAYVRLRAARDEVAALDAWLHWIDDEAYRGLNAGPFELLAETPRASSRSALLREGGMDALQLR